ncbi:MAG: AAA family ATPase, partial [Clostridia bacterium]|nr:AAA family ATPase [Clostridia bacterium]
AGGFEFEKKLNDIRAKIRAKTGEKELLFRAHTANETKLSQLRAEQDKLSSRLWDDYELTRSAAMELDYPRINKEERGAVHEIQTECRNKLRALGSVNIGAIEEYADVKTRYDYMSGQIKDLEKAKQELCDIIGKLEKEMKTSFIDAFNAINENFHKTFSELFGGGSAEILLTDPEDVLNSGIEIKAAPPGKIIKSLMQLSGGEQSFVAIALFFAILQVNPTPFCILDEIEAALDEVNVARFGEYIKRYSGGTQFILITHRRGTMEVADRLYGVTMAIHGISKVLALNVADIRKTEGDDWDGIFGQA